MIGFVLILLACINMTLAMLVLLGVIAPADYPNPGVVIAMNIGIFLTPGVLLVLWGRRARKWAAQRTATMLVADRDTERHRPAARVERPLTPRVSSTQGMSVEERESALAALRPVLARKSAQAVTEALEKKDYGSALDLGLGVLVKVVGENPADSLGQRVGDLLCGLPRTERFWKSFVDAAGSIKDLAEHTAGLYPEDSREREMLGLIGSNLEHAMARSDLPDAVQLFGKLMVHLWRYRARGDEQLADDNCQAFFLRWRKMFGRENRVLFLISAALLDYASTTEVARG